MSTTASTPQPTLDPADAAVGPFYDTDGLARWRGTSAQAVVEQAEAGRLIAVTAEGREIYPTWQFDVNGEVHASLAAAWNVLREHADPWTAAIWLHTPQSAFDGVDAAAWIAHGGDRQGGRSRCRSVGRLSARTRDVVCELTNGRRGKHPHPSRSPGVARNEDRRFRATPRLAFPQVGIA